MATLLSHILVKPEAIARWEEILRVMVSHTQAEEPDCLRYEYWRGQEPGRYYALLSFRSVEAFYEHQASSYHDEFLEDFATMFAELRLEWVDPVANGGSDLRATDSDMLPATAAERLRAQVAIYPILLAQWWHAARSTD